jgi:phosphoserine phosphatase RsbU/P
MSVKPKMRFSLGKKLAAMILLMGTVLCATALFVSYRTYQTRSTAFYRRLGESIVTTLAMRLDPSELDRYYETGEMDEAYYETQNLIRDLVESHGVEYLYVVRPHGIGVTFLFDSDMSSGEQGEYYDGGYCALGTYVDLVGDFAENLDNLLAGRAVEPITQRDESYGWQMTVMTPVLHENGTMAAYVMADISMNEVVEQQRAFLLYTGGLLAALTAFFVIVYLLWIRKSFIRPVQQLTRAARDYAGTEDKRVFDKVDIRGSDELRTLSDAFRKMLGELDANAAEQTRLALREQRMESELQLANELNASMLPKALPQREGGYPFEVCGLTHHGKELGGSFYDYFLLDGDGLCVVAAEVPGSGIPQALYTVVAQATLKSRIRSGLSLTEAMSAVNRQLYEMGGGLFLNAAVGVLDGVTGHFSCVNAGQTRPLLLRSGDRYEWMDVPQCVPLGQNENVIYRSLELELRQGDRIFFHTSQLDDIPDAVGRTFGTDKLRLTLNLAKGRQDPLSRRLQTVSDAAGAYAEHLDSIGGYALLVLEYQRRDPAQAHCLLTADDSGTAELTAFLRGQMTKNGIEGKQTAALVILAEELFTLCRRQCGKQQRLMAECVVPPAEEVVLLRLRGDFGGSDPLEQPEGEAAWAVDFIRKNSDRVLFEHTDTGDTVTVVKRMPRGQTMEGGENS